MSSPGEAPLADRVPPAPTPDRSGARLVHREGDGEQAIEVREDSHSRWLQFGAGAIQSLVDRRQPERLALPYTRAMLGWLLFREPPRRALMLGLGAGVLLRWMLRHWPTLEMRAVDADARMPRLASDWFGAPMHSPSVRFECADARDYLRRTARRFDLVMLDVFDHHGMPDWLHEPAPYQAIAAHLGGGGIMAANVWLRGESEFLAVVRAVREAFDGRVLLLPLDGYYNVIVLGFERVPSGLALARIALAARSLSQEYGLPAAELVGPLCKANPISGGCLVM